MKYTERYTFSRGHCMARPMALWVVRRLLNGSLANACGIT